jgi:DNA-binding MurR/RpiR family transcriptional regulator
VGRFCRALGYPHFKALKTDLKNDLGDSPWLIGDRLHEFLQDTRPAAAQTSASLQKEIAALVRVHEHVQSKPWAEACARLSQAARVCAIGFQTERGIALSFVNLLQYLREGVQLVDAGAGNYSDVLLGQSEDTVLVVFEARRYSRHALMLCRRAREAGISVMLITDDYCDWADQYCDYVFRVPTDLNLFWDSTAPMLSLVYQMTNDVFKRLGKGAETRLDSVASLHNEFVGYTSSSANTDP